MRRLLLVPLLLLAVGCARAYDDPGVGYRGATSEPIVVTQGESVDIPFYLLLHNDEVPGDRHDVSVELDPSYTRGTLGAVTDLLYIPYADRPEYKFVTGFVYTAPANLSGFDSFGYRVCAELLGRTCDQGVVTVTVLPKPPTTTTSTTSPFEYYHYEPPATTSTSTTSTSTTTTSTTTPSSTTTTSTTTPTTFPPDPQF